MCPPVHALSSCHVFRSYYGRGTGDFGRRCAVLPACPTWAYESAPPVYAATTRTCANLTTCVANQLQTVAPTATSDRICVATDALCGNHTGTCSDTDMGGGPQGHDVAPCPLIVCLFARPRD